MNVEWWLDSGSDFKGGAVPTAWEAAVNTDRAVAETLALGDNTSNEFYITGVQLEVGEQATPFEHRSYGDELARCQRYTYYTGQTDSSNYEKMGIGSNISTTQSSVIVFFPVTMRTQPSLTTTGVAAEYGLYNTADRQCSAVPSLNTNSTTHIGACTFQVGSGLTSGGCSLAQEHAGSGAYLIWDAEL
jgi:hypothetical protein